MTVDGVDGTTPLSSYSQARGNQDLSREGSRYLSVKVCLEDVVINGSSEQRTVYRRNVIELRNGWTDWLSAHEWTWYGTFTFRTPSLSEKWADRLWKTWTRALEQRLAPPRARRGRVRWARATEWQQRGALHYHALLHGPQLDHENPEEWSKTWWRVAHGYAQIAFPEDVRACAGYLAKHVPARGVIDVGGPWKLSAQ